MRLKIKDWEKHFENLGRKPQKAMQWFPMPVRGEGTGFRKLSVQEANARGAYLFGLWVLILCTTAELDLGERGAVARTDGTFHTPESLHARFGFATVEQWEEAIAFFCDPAIGWLVDEEAPAQAAQPLKVAVMPLPKIEQPSIYDQAAERMIARYVNAGAPIDRIPEAMAVSGAIYRKCDQRGPVTEHAALVELIEDNQQAYIESQPPKMLKTLDAWISSGLSLAARKGPKRYERGSLEAMIQTEVLAGRMTAEDARKQGVEL